MSLDTFSIFYYGFDISDDERFISFNEGSGEIIAELDVGSYTATQLAVHVQDAMNAIGSNTYFVTFNRATRTYEIESNGPNFDLLVATGTSGQSAFPILGFTGSDRTGTNTYTGSEAGDFYEPQFVLQDHIAKENYQKLADAAINKTANGRIEVVKFGLEKFMQANIKYVTNRPSDGVVIKNNATGVEDLQRFMQFATQKKPFEYMADIDNRAVFDTLILESTTFDRNGTGYQLKELYDKGLPLIFETGVLTFRVVET